MSTMLSAPSDNVKTVRLDQGRSTSQPEEVEFSNFDERHEMKDAVPNYTSTAPHIKKAKKTKSQSKGSKLANPQKQQKLQFGHFLVKRSPSPHHLVSRQKYQHILLQKKMKESDYQEQYQMDMEFQNVSELHSSLLNNEDGSKSDFNHYKSP